MFFCTEGSCNSSLHIVHVGNFHFVKNKSTKSLALCVCKYIQGFFVHPVTLYKSHHCWPAIKSRNSINRDHTIFFICVLIDPLYTNWSLKLNIFFRLPCGIQLEITNFLQRYVISLHLKYLSHHLFVLWVHH